MKFWDSSALVPLCVAEPTSDQLKTIAIDDPQIIAWWGTTVECRSAFARRRRDGLLSPEEETLAGYLLQRLASSWAEIQPSNEVRRIAIDLLRKHDLRAADALQLAAAKVWVSDPAGDALVTFDKRLRETAHLEGFAVLP